MKSTGREHEANSAVELLALKEVPRSGWSKRCVPNPESVADHSWGTAFLCFVHADAVGVDRERAVKMAIIHDLAEVDTGDVPWHAGRPESSKTNAERTAIGRISRLLEASVAEDLKALWEEYEHGASEVARFVRDMNLVEMCAQAVRYARSNPDLDLLEFLDSSENRISGEYAQNILDGLRNLMVDHTGRHT